MPDARLVPALPFWLSLGIVPVLGFGAWMGGLWPLLADVYVFGVFSLLDRALGLNQANPDPDTPVSRLFWHRLVTLVWAPVQLAMIFGLMAWVTRSGHLNGHEQALLFGCLGIATGGVGIVYAHELMHQKTPLERWLGDILMASVLYSHFRSEHLRVHHLWVATPRDPVTARYNEGFWRFFARVLGSCPQSAFRAERALLARGGKPVWHHSNPFWRYALLQAGFLALAWAIAGGWGVALFALQALIAIWLLELTNYVEHYGLTREHLGDGRYEPVRPHHSWNAAHMASNWLFINLQRHSDHHYKPDRRFPLLQTYGTDSAPQLPLGYQAMVIAAAIPPLWRRIMNPRVRAWRRQFYPGIQDWSAYKTARNPMPRGAS
ncbi:MAG: alkane 1-monooxygenase [Rhodobacter sp.]|uniref:alkane 1-monooxygenase n=1 Tax=Pararhodobacter sp. TaxID=2127056 RepID=UPI002C5A0AC6|nr:alkane 1-monooxygenase [Pararhodobacter sp.]MCC0072440.1 alkane 1-monooxygenase [Rhodobacter sp.]HPD91270.1 alkane 1-monooxygenase [Pararhodobacter sp.]